MRGVHLSEEDPENGNTPPSSDALTASIKDFLGDNDPAAIKTHVNLFGAFGCLNESTQTHFVMCKIACFHDLMAGMIRKFLFSELTLAGRKIS
jgi:hypothetical protein